MFNCPHCWDNPCTCGYEYSYWTKKEALDLIKHFTKQFNLTIEDFNKIINKTKKKK